jgi:hypothetical protein
LKAGIVEDGAIKTSDEGTPQGANMSPTLANVYLHYVLDLWFDKAVKKNCRGQADMIRYADDFVCCFQYKEEAEKFLRSLKGRLAKFNLEVAEDKTKILMFGRYAAQMCQERGIRKPETFDFLGFTHRCGKSKNGKFRIKRKTSSKKFREKVKTFKNWMQEARHDKVDYIMKTVAAKLRGHYSYYGITDNREMLRKFRNTVVWTIFKWLNRRSQRKSFTFDKFDLLLKKFKLPYPRIYVNIYGIKAH